MGKSEILSEDENKKLNEEMLRMREKKNMPARQEGIEEEEKENPKQTGSSTYDEPLPNGTLLEYKEGENTILTYQIKEEISSGRFGKIYKAEIKGIKNNYSVAIKEFCPRGTLRHMDTLTLEIDPKYKQYLDDFKKEPDRINGLLKKDPNDEWDKYNLVIPQSEIFTWRGNYYYAMEYVKGQNLQTFLIENYENLSTKDRIGILYQIAIAIRSLHSIGCIHQDLSPNNVMIQKRNDGSFRIKVIDYGMSTTLYDSSGKRQTNIKDGRTYGFTDDTYLNYRTYLKYFDDEKERGRVKLIDIYSLGALLAYICLTELATIQDESILDFLTSALKGEKGESVHTAEAEKKEKINDMIRNLVADATFSNLEVRAEKFKDEKDAFGYINVFLSRLDEINVEIGRQEFYLTIIEDGENNPEGQVPAKENEVIKEEPEPQNSKETNPEEGSVDTTAEIIKKAENGDAIAQSNLGLWYELGLEMPRDMRKAKEWYAKAAAQGDTTAQYKLGCFYEEGKGGPKNLNEAIKWYTQAAQQGHAVSKIALKRLSRKRIFYRRLAFLSILGGIAFIAAIIFGIYKVYPEVFPFSSNQPKQEQASMDNRVTPETDLVEIKTEKPIENKEQQAQTVKQQIQTEERKLPSNEKPTRTADKIQEGHNTSTIDVSALTPANLTTLMGKAQTDVVIRERLFNVFADGIIFLVMDENGNAFDLPRLKLFNNLEENAYQIGKTHRVDNFENENGKIRIIYLTEIK